MDTHPDPFTQADWDALCGACTKPPQIKPEIWLRMLDGLTSDHAARTGGTSAEEPPRTCPDDAPDEQSTASPVASATSFPPRLDVSQQLCGGGMRYGFELARRTYFDHCSDPLLKSTFALSRRPKTLSCDYSPDFKCKEGTFAVISTCTAVPVHGLCGRCGSVGDHLMICCMDCCDSYHSFCAHIPAELIPRLTSWYCHQCAACSLCGGTEESGKQFTNDVIETCYRCHKQYHLYCNNNTNFVLLLRNSSNEFKVCNSCFISSACLTCHQVLSGDDLCRDFSSGSADVCIVCRNAKERAYCKRCCDIPELRKFACSYCSDVYHAVCAEAGRQIGKAFICPSCINNRQISPHVLWTTTYGQSIVDKVRKYVVLLMNWELSGRNCNSSAAPAVPVENKIAWVVSESSSNLEITVDGSQNMEEDLGIHLLDDAEEEPNRTDPRDRKVGLVKLFVANKFRADPLSDDFSDQPSPDSGIPRSGSGASSPDGTALRELNFAFPDSFSALCEIGNMRRLSFCAGNGLYGKPHISAVQPVILTDQCAPCVDREKNTAELCIYPRLLRDLMMLREDVDACGNAEEFVGRLTDLVALCSITTESRCALQQFCSELTQWMPAMARANRSRPPSIWRNIMPLSRLQDRTTLSLVAPILSERTVSFVDCRMCMLCSVAGDDYNGVAGRLISVGFDLWAHIGCISFFSTRKLFWDYAIFILDNLEGFKFWRKECASCPLRFGMIGCLKSRCPNSYHLNCALDESCVILPSEGVLCPMHKGASSLSIRNNLALLNKGWEMPVYCRASPAAIRSFIGNDWAAMRKDDLYVYFGGSVVRSLGRLVPGWDVAEALIPCGYSMRKWYWSTINPLGLTQYRFFTVDLESNRDLRAKLCSILEVECLPGWSPVAEIRSEKETVCEAVPAQKASELEEAEIIPDFGPEDRISIKVENCSPVILSEPGGDVEMANSAVAVMDISMSGITLDLSSPSGDECSESDCRNRSLSPEISIHRIGSYSSSAVKEPQRQHHPRPRNSGIPVAVVSPVGNVQEVVRIGNMEKRITRSTPSADVAGGNVKQPQLPSTTDSLPLKDFTDCDLTLNYLLLDKQNAAHDALLLPTLLKNPDAMARTRNGYNRENIYAEPINNGAKRVGFARKSVQLPRSNYLESPDKAPGPVTNPHHNSHFVNCMQGMETSCTGHQLPVRPIERNTHSIGNLPKKRQLCDGNDNSRTLSSSPPVIKNGICLKKSRIVTVRSPKSVHIKSGELPENETQRFVNAKAAVPVKKSSHAPGIRSVLASRSRPRPVGVKVKKVRFASPVREHPVDSSEFHPYGGTLPQGENPVCLMPPVEDPDPNPYLFTHVKAKAREEVSKRRQKRIRELRDYLERHDWSGISKTPSRMCILMGDDGFFAVSPSPLDLIEHLYHRLQEARNSRGSQYLCPSGSSSTPSPFDFLGLTHPTVQFLLEQLPVPCSSPSSYHRQFFSAEELKNRGRSDLEPTETSSALPLATCPTCPLPTNCFAVISGRTFLKTAVQCRQVLFRWTVPYGQRDSKVDTQMRISSGVYVVPKEFPEFYTEIRHSDRPTAVLIYAVHPLNAVVTLAFIATTSLPVGSEIRYNSSKTPRAIDSRLYLSDFHCVKHNRKE